MVQEDEKVGVLMNSEKKSKKRKKKTATNDSEVTNSDVKAVEHDPCFKEEQLSLTGTRKERDKKKIETKAPGESEDSDIKRKKETGGGKQRGKSSTDSSEDTVKNVLEKKKKLNKEQETSIQSASFDTKSIAHESTSKIQESEAAETLSEGSGGNLTDEVKRKKRKKDKRKKENGQVQMVAGVIQSDVAVDEVKRKKRKKDKKKKEDDHVDIVAAVTQGYAKKKKRGKDKMKKDDVQVGIVAGVIQGDVSAMDEVKRKKRKQEDGQVDIMAGIVKGDDGVYIRKRKKTKLGHNSKNLTSEKTEKRVRFSDHVQFLPPLSDPVDEKHEHKEENLLLGKRFTQEEDEIIKDAVYRYIEVYNLGVEGLQKVLNCMSNPEVRGCWKEIVKAIPYRPYSSVYHRAQRLFWMGEVRKWTEEEYELVRKFQRKHGNKWIVLANKLGRYNRDVAYAWHNIKLENRKRGHWDQEEIQKLFDLVNTDLQLKFSEEKKSRRGMLRGMLRDNIRWSAISNSLSTRNSIQCCSKWYRQLTSSMVSAGEWAYTDDYRLINALFELDASCIEDVDWDNLLAHRDGDISRKRWKEMVRQISQHEKMSFAAQVEVLAKRYRPDLVGAREAWDNKPVVP